jgi:hypothetical protein
MIAQRAALDEAIDDLKTQLQSGRRNLAEIEAARSAAQ